MVDTLTCNSQGQSGETYRYWVYALPASFGAGQAGNYIYARRDNQDYWALSTSGKATCATAQTATIKHTAFIEGERATFTATRTRTREHAVLRSSICSGTTPRPINRTAATSASAARAMVYSQRASSSHSARAAAATSRCFFSCSSRRVLPRVWPR